MTQSRGQRRSELFVPERCSRGHLLTPPTTHVRTSRQGDAVFPTGWSCVRCLRTELWIAHYPGVPVPADILAEDRFHPQTDAFVGGLRAAWCDRVLFLSDRQFADYPAVERSPGRKPRRAAA